MKKLGSLINLLRDDVNDEESVVVGWFTKVVDFLFISLLMAGIPFFLYVLLQFKEIL